MKPCINCGTRFLPDQPHHVLCGECIGSGVVDGSAEQYALLYALERLLNMTEADAKMVADTVGWSNVALRVLPLMEAKCLRNLLRKALREL